MADLVILGGGASGLMAAVSAAQFIPGRKILVLEQGPGSAKSFWPPATAGAILRIFRQRLSATTARRPPLSARCFPSFLLRKHWLFFQAGPFLPGGGAGPLLSSRQSGLGGTGCAAPFSGKPEVEERCGVRVEGLQKKPAGYELTTGAGTVFAKN